MRAKANFLLFLSYNGIFTELQKVFYISFICRCLHPQGRITRISPIPPGPECRFTVLPSLSPSCNAAVDFGMGLIQNIHRSSWTTPALVLGAEVTCDVKQDIIPGNAGLLNASWPGGEGLILVYLNRYLIASISSVSGCYSIVVLFWPSGCSFCLVTVEIQHPCKGEQQKKKCQEWFLWTGDISICTEHLWPCFVQLGISWLMRQAQDSPECSCRLPCKIPLEAWNG